MLMQTVCTLAWGTIDAQIHASSQRWIKSTDKYRAWMSRMLVVFFFKSDCTAIFLRTNDYFDSCPDLNGKKSDMYWLSIHTHAHKGKPCSIQSAQIWAFCIDQMTGGSCKCGTKPLLHALIERSTNLTLATDMKLAPSCISARAN